MLPGGLCGIIPPKGGGSLLYAARYEERGLSRREEGQLQRRLARALLGLALRREFSLELDALPMERGPQGKPYFPGVPVEFSLSHCRGMVCAGLSAVPLGVDVQPARPYSQRLARRICTPEELAWLKGSPQKDRDLMALWTWKEAVMKLWGQGMSYGFQQAAFRFPQGDPVPVDGRVTLSRFFLGEVSLAAASLGESFPSIIEVPRGELPLWEGISHLCDS